MTYRYETNVKKNDAVRASFNALTRRTFGFDFTDWYEAGQWGDFYIPHVLLDGDRVISNVSVNLMQFDVLGVKKNYIQLGTVMTDAAYRGKGFNRDLMERVLEQYAGKTDGIYLFGNDSVLDYYPKFGFRPLKEYEYYQTVEKADAYILEKIDMKDKRQREKFYRMLYAYKVERECLNRNDAMYMNENVNLFQFWLSAGYEDKIFYLPEADACAIAEIEGAVVHVCQIFGKEEVEIVRLAKAFGEEVKEVVLGYTPVHKEKFLVREHKEADATLFVLEADRKFLEQDKRMFPVLSHA